MEKWKSLVKKDVFHDRCMILFLMLNFLAMLISAIRNVIIHGINNNPPLFCDHEWIYRELVYALRGVDMSTAIAENVIFNDIGLVQMSSTWPWTKVLGVIVHGAFLPFELSKIYICVFHLIVIVLAAICINKCFISHHHVDKKQWGYVIGIITLIFLSSWYYIYLVCAFNNGSFVCLAIISALALEKKYPVISGIIMAFAMIKAQIALPFFAIFLLRKKWKMIASSVSIVLTAWVGSCVLTNVTPWRQIINLLDGQMTPTAASHTRYGMADFILLFDNSKILFTMVISMVLGLLILWIVEVKFIDEHIKERYLLFSYFPAAIVSLLWCYTTKCDYLILTVVALGTFELWFVNIKSIKNTIFFCIILGCTIMNLTGILAQILARIGLIPIVLAQPLEGRFDTVVLLLMMIVLIIKRYENSSLAEDK